MFKRFIPLAVIVFLIVLIVYMVSSSEINVTTVVGETKQITTTDHSKKVYSKQLDDIAFTVFAEDRSTKQGMQFVLSTIINRANSTDISKMHAVVLKKKQYSCWVNGKRVKQTFKRQDRRMYRHALALVKKATQKQFKPVTEATHYYNPSKVTPPWLYQFVEVAFINEHIYLVRRKNSDTTSS